MGWQGWDWCGDTGALARSGLAVPKHGVVLPPGAWGCRVRDLPLPFPVGLRALALGLSYPRSAPGWGHPSTPRGHLQSSWQCTSQGRWQRQGSARLCPRSCPWPSSNVPARHGGCCTLKRGVW